MDSVPRDVTLPSLDRLSAVTTSSTLDRETAGLLRVQGQYRDNNLHGAMASSASPSTATFGNDSSEGSNGLMALPAVMDLVADSQDEPGSGGSALFSDISTPTRSWKQIDVRQESKQRESPPRRSSSSPATPRTSQKGVRSTSKGGRSKLPTSAEFRAAIKEKNKMEMEIGEYQKTLDEMLAAMANLHQEDYGSTIRIQELERRCEIASKQSGHLVSHHQHHMAEAWRKFEEEAQQMRKVEMNAYQYGEKKDMESNVIIQQMRQAEGTIVEQKREIAVMKSYMASEKSAAQESAIRANQIHREASQQISVYQQQIRGIESSTSIEKFNEEEMVQSLKSQLEHALVKRPETYSMEDSREETERRYNIRGARIEESRVLTSREGRDRQAVRIRRVEEGPDDCYRSWS